MGEESKVIELLRQEATYYKKKVDELAGENLQMDYTISGLRHQLKQKREGFSLLSTLHNSIGTEAELTAIFKVVISSINSTLGMDKTVVLLPGEKENSFRTALVLGPNLQIESYKDTNFQIPVEVATGKETLIVTKASQPSELELSIQKTFELPYFIVSGVSATNGQSLGVIISGRMLEAKPLYPALDKGDADTFAAIGSLISATMEVMKVTSLKETDRLKTEFFANISHEFRTPITLTIGPLEALMNGRYGEVNERIQREIEIVLRNQRRLLDLINQILDLAKMESGAMKAQFSPLKDLNGFIRLRTEQFQSLVEKRKISLITEWDDPQKQEIIFIDQEKMDKVIFNLLSNALKFTPSGTIHVKTKFRPGEVEIEIQDTGIGIKSDQLAHIFDRFRQADGSASREFAGTGIGLSLVQEIIKIHSGKIQVFSEYGKGTRFQLKFPTGAAHLPPDSISSEAPVSAAIEAGLSRPVEIREGRATAADLQQVEKLNQEAWTQLKKRQAKILYVDDNPDLRTFVHGVLSQDFNVFLAVNGQDGFDKAKLYQVDLVLSDLMMPVMTGSELLEKLRTDVETREIPFVMLTAKTGLDSKIQELNKGTDDYLNKPFSEAELRARIHNLLRIREQQRRIKSDLRAARQIQQTLLPPSQQTFPGLEMEILYQPCEDLSGDFYEVQQVGDHVYFYVADVTSHGTASAQVTYLLKGIFKHILSQVSENEGIGEIVAQLSREYANYRIDYSVGLCFGRYHIKTRLFEYVNSNAPAPYLVSAEGGRNLPISPNPVIDYTFGELAFEANSCTLNPGECVFIYTDGAIELGKTSDLNTRLLRKVLSIFSKLNTQDWRESLLQALTQLNGNSTFADDMTVLRLKIQTP